MLSYELAKKLKDAGFIGNQSSGLLYDLEKRLSYNFVSYWSCSSRIDTKMKISEEDIYVPTLSELIEACGEKGFILYEYENKFYAGKKENGCRDTNYYDDYPDTCEGATPEEAVTNLWLELNQK